MRLISSDRFSLEKLLRHSLPYEEYMYMYDMYTHMCYIYLFYLSIYIPIHISIDLTIDLLILCTKNV